MPAKFVAKLCLGLAGVVSTGAIAVEEASSSDACASGDEECSSLIQLKGQRPAAAAGGRPLASHSSSYAAGLLQALQNASAERAKSESEIWCPGVEVKPLKPAVGASMVEKYLGGKRLGWWTMPEQPWDNLEKQGEGLEVVPWPDGTPEKRKWPLMKKGPAADVLKKMYNATKVEGVFEKMPEKMRGIFWMHGNAVAEELTIAHYGKYFPEENILMGMQAPYTWAWPGGRPTTAPMGGVSYSDDEISGLRNAAQFINLAAGFTYEWADRCEGAYCFLRRGEQNMSYAYMQFHSLGNVKEAIDLGDMASDTMDLSSMVPEGTLHGAFTLQEMSGSVDGSHWKRTCHWGIGDTTCAFVEFGSYDLLKIVDGDGRRCSRTTTSSSVTWATSL